MDKFQVGDEVKPVVRYYAGTLGLIVGIEREVFGYSLPTVRYIVMFGKSAIDRFFESELIFPSKSKQIIVE